jgi:hypothetical protein
MNAKRAVQFRKHIKLSHQWQRLRYCRACGSYTVLPEEPCSGCGSQSFVTLQEYAATLNNRLFYAEGLVLAAFLGVAALAARNFLELGIALLGAAVVIALYFLLKKHFRPSEEICRLQKITNRHMPSIREGLLKDALSAGEDLKNDRHKEAYEKLREVGSLLTIEHVKNLKIMCLNQLIIRKDMELELETLLPAAYNKEFITYLYEVSKVNKSLIRQSVLDYLLTHRLRIEQLPFGKELMINASVASLRMRPYIERFYPVILDYMEFLPKERFLRLCKLVNGATSGPLARLQQACREAAKVRYGFDPDVQAIWQEG